MPPCINIMWVIMQNTTNKIFDKYCWNPAW